MRSREFADIKLTTRPTIIVRCIACVLIFMAFSGCAAPETASAVQAMQGEPAPPHLAETANRIQAKISQIGARATKLHDSGADVSQIQNAMKQVDQRLKAGDYVAAERILDMLLANLGLSAPRDIKTAEARETATCDATKPMTVTGRVTVSDDCTIGGDLTVTGSGFLYFDYRNRRAGRVVVAGNVIVEQDGTLQVDGRPDGRAVFAVDNDFNQQRSMTSRDRARIKLTQVEFRTQKSVDRSKGSVYMSYEARDRSSFEATGSRLVEAESWLLANLHNSATLTVTDTEYVPTEIYVHDASAATIRGAGTRAGLWLDAQGTKGTLTLPDVNRPFSWRVGAGDGLDVPWRLQVENAQPGLGVEVKPGAALTINGNGARAPQGGELKISYFVVGSSETLDGLKVGVQNRRITDRLTLNNVQLGPIAWQLYAGDNADLTVRNSTINEIGVFGRNARVLVERSVLQLAVLAALAPGSSLSIRNSEVWNQAAEVGSQAQISITDSQIHGTRFHAKNADSRISITGGVFHDNPAGCNHATMVNIETGQPRCNPFGAPGGPRSMGAGKVECSGTKGCRF